MTAWETIVADDSAWSETDSTFSSLAASFCERGQDPWKDFDRARRSSRLNEVTALASARGLTNLQVKGRILVRVAHFVQRYPPALGGSEAYFARLSRYLAAAGDRVTVFTTTALDLEAFWSRQGRCLDAGLGLEEGVEIRRYALWRWPGRRYLLKALSLCPHRLWQCLMLPCNPIAPTMWTAAGNGAEAFDLVHATAFPYAWPIVCGLRLAQRLRVPFLLTPFLHLGDPEDPNDPLRRAYLSPALLALIRAADGVFVQTDLERAALVNQGIAAEKLVLLGMGVDAKECTGGKRTRIRQE